MPGKLLSLLLLSAALSLPGPAQAQADARGTGPGSPNPLVGLNWFVDTHWHPAWRTYNAWSHSRPADAQQILKIARQPQFRWFGRWDRNIHAKVTYYFKKIDRMQPGAVPGMTILRAQSAPSRPPNRRTGRSPNAGRGYDRGPAEDRAYQRWIRDFASAVGHRRVVIAFEPDRIGSLNLLSRRARRAQMRGMRKAVDILSGLPNATIYLEGGASDWRPARRTAGQLRYLGIHKVRGFMLNATHFDWTSRNIRHGLKISRMVGGKPFVVSTHQNGRGPQHYWRRVGGHRRRINMWCNPRNTALGSPPTTSTGHPRVDAYLWIGRAGYSGGRCRGGPRHGTFWPEYALSAARRTPWG